MGLVRNPKKAGRVIDYDGLNRSKTMSKDSVYMSDVDSICEFDDKFLIITEIKEDGVALKTGQRLLFERLAKSWVNSGEGKKAVVFFATHHPDILEVVPVAECTVQQCYTPENGWVGMRMNMIDCLFKLGDKWGIDKLKR